MAAKEASFATVTEVACAELACSQLAKLFGDLEFDIKLRFAFRLRSNSQSCLGADMACIRIDIELDQSEPRLMGAHRLQRSASAADQGLIARDARTEKGGNRVACPDLRITFGQRRRPITVWRHAVMNDLQRAFARLV